MKKILYTAIAAIVVFSFGCSKDDDDNPADPSGSYTVNYKNQNLQGMINGEAWEYILGESNTSDGGYNTDYTHNFNIVDTAQSDSCFILSGERSKVIFSLYDDLKVLSVGKYLLSFDISTFEGRTVTLVDWTETTVLNTIATEGEYEIISVDTISQIITGRMDAHADNKNFVNGNFTIKYCYWQ